MKALRGSASADAYAARGAPPGVQVVTLLMTAGQSLYALYVETTGAHTA